ncbi:MAG: aminoacyl-tRNA hydrolase [Chlorobiaceae bacterium]|nr:aminoacyl-tRNA hydrolase [Chlorobiaceae bacterium]
MFIIVGLGNHGSEYEHTRHNIGFDVVDSIAAQWHLTLRHSKSEYLMAQKSIAGKEIILIKPLTYMNNSGLAVQDVLYKYEADIENLLIIVDDFHLPLRTLRLRKRGSAGGHNGLASIIYTLGTEQFSRLRCGIGSESMPKPNEPTSDFVLSPFDDSEKDKARQMIETARDAVTTLIHKGIDFTVQHLNNK